MIADLKRLLGAKRVAVDADTRDRYRTDWSRVPAPLPEAVTFPETAEQVQDLVCWAKEKSVPLVPVGGQTGLSGGAAAVAGGVSVSFQRMSRILACDAEDSLVRCEAGTVTRDLQDYVRQRGLFYPVDLAAAGSSHIGGNVATNAGGMQVLRYGMTRNWVAGLRVVTGSGELLNLDRALAKDNAGYDLCQLFIGSEGTLGLITEAALRLTRLPRSPCVLLLSLSELEALPEVTARFRSEMELQAAEFFTEAALAKVLAAGESARPLPSAPCYLLLEFENPGGRAAARGMEIFAEEVQAGRLRDGVAGESEAQHKKLWRLREDITATLAPLHPRKYDLCLQPSKLPAFLQEAEVILKESLAEAEAVWFGHAADGNLHLNLLPPKSMEPGIFAQHCRAAEGVLFAAVRRLGGSASAEHGIGLLKKSWLAEDLPPAVLASMRALKAAFDPKGILNPGKVLEPAEAESGA